MAKLSRKVEKIKMWVEYRFGDADRKEGATRRVPISGVADLIRLPRTLPSESSDLTDGIPSSFHIEMTFEGGHVAYCETGKLGGAFGGLTIEFNEALGLT